jgi:hypothetical protein
MWKQGTGEKDEQSGTVTVTPLAVSNRLSMDMVLEQLTKDSCSLVCLEKFEGKLLLFAYFEKFCKTSSERFHQSIAEISLLACEALILLTR